jgi:two-component system NarL family sensor kinase
MYSEKLQAWGLIFLIILLFILGGLITIVFILHQKKFHFNKKLLKVESEFQKSTLLTQLEIQEQTFRQISREIHDHIGQRLTLARLYINKLSGSIPQKEFEAISESSILIEEAIGDLKNLSRSLTANVIRDEGLLHAMQLETKRVSKITGLKIDIETNDELPFLSVENELIIFRIIQESLQNIIRHAEASTVHILYIYSSGELLLNIRDDGKGFDPLIQQAQIKLKKSSGLENLKKRADLLHGDFNIHSGSGKGTLLKFRFPYQKNLSAYAPV